MPARPRTRAAALRKRSASPASKKPSPKPVTVSGEMPSAKTSETASSRELSFDAYKGLAILAVILHHVSGAGLRNTVIGSTSRLLMAFVNRSLLFCVPAFLFFTVFLLSRSFLRKPMSPPEFWRRRVPRILTPYLLWSLIYILFNVDTGQADALQLLQPERWRYWLLFGKANFHLYFLVIVLQVYLFLPDLLRAIQARRSLPLRTAGIVWTGLALLAAACLYAWPSLPVFQSGVRWIGWLSLAGAIYLALRQTCALASRWNRGLWPWLALAFGMQIAIYFVHKFFIRSAFPATLALWYVVPVLMGIWAASNYVVFQQNWPRLRGPMAALTLLSLFLFFPVALREVNGQRVDSFHYVALYWGYTGIAALALLGLCLDLTARFPRLARFLAFPGAYSMELYLLHPMLLSQVTRWKVGGTPLELAAYLLAVFLGLTALTLLLAMGLRNLGGSLLFGR